MAYSSYAESNHEKKFLFGGQKSEAYPYASQRNCIHFPDLAEVRSGRLYPDMDISSIPTEFVFATTGTCVGPEEVKTLLKLGFKEVGAMKNWHWIHHREWHKPIRLFWQRVRPAAEAKPQTPAPEHFHATGENTHPYHKAEYKTLQWNGCGLKVGEKISRHSYYRYFSLLRLPINPDKRTLRWLKYANYRLIETGSIASFWCNGWKNADEWSITKEKNFWKKRGISFEERLDFTYQVKAPMDKALYKPGLRVALRDHIQSGKEPFTTYFDKGMMNPGAYIGNDNGPIQVEQFPSFEKGKWTYEGFPKEGTPTLKGSRMAKKAE